MSVLILFVYKLTIGSSKNVEKIIRENALVHKKKKPRLNLTPGKALIGLRTTEPWQVSFNPWILKSDHHQFSHNNLNTPWREKVRRINEMITKGKCFDLLSNSPNVHCIRKMYGDQSGEFDLGAQRVYKSYCTCLARKSTCSIING